MNIQWGVFICSFLFCSRYTLQNSAHDAALKIKFILSPVHDALTQTSRIPCNRTLSQKRACQTRITVGATCALVCASLKHVFFKLFSSLRLRCIRYFEKSLKLEYLTAKYLHRPTNSAQLRFRFFYRLSTKRSYI